MIQVAHDMPPHRKPRPYLSFPRGRRLSSPRILLLAGDLAAHLHRGVALAETLLTEFPGSSLVVASGSEEGLRLPERAHLDIVKLPGIARGNPPPLESERVRRLRQKFLRTLFDVFLPDVVLLDRVSLEAEARLLSARAGVLGAAALRGVEHDEVEPECGSETRSGEPVCVRCSEQTVSAVRAALAARSKGPPG